MTARQAAQHYIASLVERQLAAAHTEFTIYKTGGEGLLSRYSLKYGGYIVLDTFEHAPPNVLAALENGLDRGDVAEEMAKIAEEIRSAETP